MRLLGSSAVSSGLLQLYCPCQSYLRLGQGRPPGAALLIFKPYAVPCRAIIEGMRCAYHGIGSGLAVPTPQRCASGHSLALPPPV